MPIYDLDELLCRDFQEDLVITELEKDVCMSCGKKYPHRKINWGCAYEGLKEVEFIMDCAKCRSDRKKIKELKDKIEKMEQEILDIEFETFRRKQT